MILLRQRLYSKSATKARNNQSRMDYFLSPSEKRLITGDKTASYYGGPKSELTRRMRKNMADAVNTPLTYREMHGQSLNALINNKNRSEAHKLYENIVAVRKIARR